LKFSYNWIRELVEGLECAAGPLERLITMKTAECEGIESVGDALDVALVARVVEVEPVAPAVLPPAGHTNNAKAIVDLGPHGRKTVVCGAPNCRPGVITLWLPVGKKVIHGVESDGMLAAGIEAGINRDHAGILELDSPVGQPLPGCSPDRIIEIDNKSITHRPDLWGHHGMAREVAAILGKKLLDPVDIRLLPHDPPAVNVQVESPELCPQYCALLIEGIEIKPSPPWLQYRLTSIGLNPINNIVDLTNFVMSELSQPMHAFDADKLHGNTIFVRPAESGEHFHALNEEKYRLEPSNLVIADAAGAIALGGVIGGMESAIGPGTTRVVLESANFQAASIRKTSAAIKLRTDASMRFEKAQDPVNTLRGIARAIALLGELSPGARVVGGVAVAKREMPAPPPILLPLDWLERKLGRAIEAAEVRRILESLEFGVAEPEPGVFSVSVPSWRATKDVSMKDDLVEEVGRMVGYDSIAPEAPLVPCTVPPANPERRFQHETRDIFVGQGFTEVYNYSFLSEEAAAAFGLDAASHVRVANPIASDQALMRRSLLPGIWRNVVENAKHRERFRLFEIGLEIHPAPAGELPREIPHLAAAIYERSGDGAAALFEIKRAAECLMPGVEAVPGEAAAYEHPARAAELVWKGQPVGRMFELHPRLIETGRAAVLDLDLSAVAAFAGGEVKYTPIRRYPPAAFDLSVIAGLREHAATLRRALEGFAGPLVESVEFVRQYSGPPLRPDQKSVSFRLTAGSPERTLSSEEVGEIRARIIQGMRGLGYELRV